MGGEKDSSLTRVQPVFTSALAHDPTGDSWLPQLLAAGRGGDLPERLLDKPGRLTAETVAKSASKKAELRCFEYQVPPDRRLLSWCIDNPEALSAPALSDPPTDAEVKRRSLICDEPLGSRAVLQQLTRAAVATEPIGQPAWWRFERATEVDCVLATDRLVLCIEGKRDERLSQRTEWLRGRNQVARNLEAAWRLAGGARAFAVLVCVEKKGDPLAEPAFVRDSLDLASAHLFPAEREALSRAYLGEASWEDVCGAIGVDYGALPNTVSDLDPPRP